MVRFRRAVCRDASTTGMHPTAPNPQGGAITRLSVPLKIRSPQIEFDAEKSHSITEARRAGHPTPQGWPFRQPKPYPRLPAWGWRRVSAACKVTIWLKQTGK